MDNITRDKNGRELKVGDVLKVYHFTARMHHKKHYMYKQIVGLRLLGGFNLTPKVEYFDVSHLNLSGADNYTISKNEGALPEYEIVQGLDDLDARKKEQQP